MRVRTALRSVTRALSLCRERERSESRQASGRSGGGGRQTELDCTRRLLAGRDVRGP